MSNLDQFYTNEDISNKCLNIFYQYVDINDYDFILEPSAGKGSFFTY